MYKFLFFFIFHVLITIGATGQVNVKGSVYDMQGRPLPYATAYLLTAGTAVVQKSAITDTAGNYVFLNVQNGEYIVESKMVGFIVARTPIFKIANQTMALQALRLESDARQLSEVTVEGKLPTVESRPGKLVLNVENSPLSAGNNALDIVQRAPGVSLDNNNNLQLMGQTGVAVTIDGRQTYMTGDQLVTFLKSTDGNQIKSVEVITSRSAKDDAEGAVGRINIVMKKNRMEGFNGMFTATAGHGERFRGNSSLSLNYMRNNTTLFGSYAYSDDRSLERIEIDRVVRNGDRRTFYAQESDLWEHERNHAYRFGIEQKTSARNTITTQFNASNNRQYDDNYSKTIVGSALSTIDSILISTSQPKEVFNRYSANMNNEFRIDSNGKKLIVDLDWSRFRNSKGAHYQNDTFDPTMSQIAPKENLRSGMPIGIDIYVGKMDFELPISKGAQIETGLKYSNVRSDNDLTFERLVGTVWNNDTSRTNRFLYREQIAAGYVDYNNTIGKWSIKLGVRGEYTSSDGNSITMAKRVKREYFDLFPNASLAYSINPVHMLSFAYARKITRPNYRLLNPFDYFIDKLTSERGNPYLNPQYSNEVTLTYIFHKKYNLTVGVNKQTDAIVESMGQDSVSGQTWVYKDNLGKNLTGYVNANVPVNVFKTWTINNNITGVYFDFDGLVSGIPLRKKSFLLQAVSMHNVKISPWFSANANFRYFSPFKYNIYDLNARWDMELGATQTFKDQRSSLKLAISDVFNTGNQNLSTDFGDFNTVIRQSHDRRVIRLTFSYKFGNLKQSVRKKDTSNDEKERAN